MPGPIEQSAFGKAGLYQIFNVSKRSMNYAEFKKRSLKEEPNFEGKSSSEIEDLVNSK